VIALRISLQFVLLVLLQKLVFSNVDLWQVAFANVALVFPLFLPTSVPKLSGLLLVFAFGLVLDVFIGAGVYGVHAFSLTFVYYFRLFWLRIITPSVRMEDDDELDLAVHIQSFTWLVQYAVPLLLVFNLVFYLLADFALGSFMLLKVLASTVYSALFVVLIGILVYRPTGRKRA
jgi:hypothetical protein